MSIDEKAARWKELYKSIEANSAQQFASNVISSLSKVQSHPTRRFSTKIPKLSATILNEACKNYKKRL